MQPCRIYISHIIRNLQDDRISYIGITALCRHLNIITILAWQVSFTQTFSSRPKCGSSWRAAGVLGISSPKVFESTKCRHVRLIHFCNSNFASSDVNLPKHFASSGVNLGNVFSLRNVFSLHLVNSSTGLMKDHSLLRQDSPSVLFKPSKFLRSSGKFPSLSSPHTKLTFLKLLSNPRSPSSICFPKQRPPYSSYFPIDNHSHGSQQGSRHSEMLR